MNRCVFCQTELEPGTRLCGACGRMQPAAHSSTPTVAASGPLVRRCPRCGEPAQPEDRFCLSCALPLRAPCPHCGQEIPRWSTFCPRCASPLTTTSRRPSGTTAYVVNAAPYAQTRESFARPSGTPSAPAAPQYGAPRVPTGQAGSQTGMPGVPGAPAGPQRGAPTVPHALGGTQSHHPGWQSGAPVRGVSQVAGRGLRAKLLGTVQAKIITAILVTAVVATGGTAAVLVAKGGVSSVPGHQSNNQLAAPKRTPQPAGITAEFPTPTSNSDPIDITAGPDGNLWFTEAYADKIGRITPNGQITEFQIPTGAGINPIGITRGPDGNLWFTEIVGKIGRITPAGQITEYPLPTPNSDPGGITRGPDGNLWFTETTGDKIGRITPGGAITEFPLPTSASGNFGIIAGPDGNLWFPECLADVHDVCSGGGKIGRITPAGQVTEFPLPNPNSGSYGITVGHDGNLWFTECLADSQSVCNGAGKIGRITPAGQITEFPLPGPPGESVFSFGITAGPDDNLWFTENILNSYGKCSSSEIGRITLGGQVTEFSANNDCGLQGITAGPDGTLWYTAFPGEGKIGRITSGA